MEKWELDRLSELTAISRERELSDAEKHERETLRAKYRLAVTGSLRDSLEHTTIIEPDGTRRKVRQSGRFVSGKKSGEE